MLKIKAGFTWGLLAILLFSHILLAKVKVGGKWLEWYLTEDRVYIRDGFVSKKDIDVSGNVIEVDTTNKRAVILGSCEVFFRQGGEQNIYGSQVFYDLKNYKGEVENARMKSGAFIYQLNHLSFDYSGIRVPQGGYITSCPEHPPHWSIRFKEAYGKPNKWLEIRHIKLYIKDHPVFYYPAKKISLEEEPIFSWRLGYSSTLGLFYRGRGYEFGKSEGWSYSFNLTTKKGSSISASRKKDSAKRTFSQSINYSDNGVTHQKRLEWKFLHREKTLGNISLSTNGGIYRIDSSNSPAVTTARINVNSTYNARAYTINMIFNRQFSLDGDKNYTGTFYFPKITINLKPKRIEGLGLSLNTKIEYTRREQISYAGKKSYTDKLFTFTANKTPITPPLINGKLRLSSSYTYLIPANGNNSVSLVYNAGYSRRFFFLNSNFNYKKTQRWEHQEWRMGLVSEGESMSMSFTGSKKLGNSNLSFTLFSGTYDFVNQHFTSGASSLNLRYNEDGKSLSLSLSAGINMNNTEISDFFKLNWDAKVSSLGMNASYKMRDVWNLTASGNLNPEDLSFHSMSLKFSTRLNNSFYWRSSMNVNLTYNFDESELTNAIITYQKRLHCMYLNLHFNIKAKEYYFTIGIGAMDKAYLKYGWSESEGFHKVR